MQTIHRVGVSQPAYRSSLRHIPGVTTVCPHLMAADWKMCAI